MVALAVLLVAAPAAAERPRRCDASPGETVAGNRWVRLYQQVRLNVPSGSTVLVGCERSSRGRRLLAESYTEYGDAHGYDHVRLRRRYAAVRRAYYVFDGHGGAELRRSRIAVFDSRTWVSRNVHAVPKRLVLAVNGGVAWAERRGRATDVRAMDSHGVRTLDSGAIRPRSLHVALTIVRWRSAGEGRFARLR
jgi:hypothetical protein